MRMKSAADVRAKLRAACEAAGGQKAWADAHGISGAYVCYCLLGRREIGEKIARALGYEPVTLYRPISSSASTE